MRRGVTLVELIVTLALLGLLSGLAAAMLGGLRRSEPDTRARELARELAQARARAVRTGARVRLDDASGTSVLFLPDGRAVGDGVDPVTGRPSDAAR
jgi:prepilin-type N-terminal cleavage/methylation domain-containing protein